MSTSTAAGAWIPPAGFPRPGAPLSTQAITGHLALFYDTIREPGPLTITSDYASSVVHRFFDLRSPVAQYISAPQPYVILQRINLGLFAILGELSATADWRAISEEIWPFTHGPASTPMDKPKQPGEHAARQPRHDGPAPPCRGPRHRQTSPPTGTRRPAGHEWAISFE